jgi:hypothetical protein
VGVNGEAAPVAAYDHLRADADAPVPAGVYRVVGTGDPVALLRVVEDGRRVRSGVVVHLDRADLAALEPAGNPDAGLGKLRQAPSALRGRPFVSALAAGFVVGGAWLAATDDAVGGGLLVASGLVVLWRLLG